MVENKPKAGQQIQSIQMFICIKKLLLAVASSGCVNKLQGPRHTHPGEACCSKKGFSAPRSYYCLKKHTDWIGMSQECKKNKKLKIFSAKQSLV